MYVKDHTVRGRNKIQDYWCPEEYVVVNRPDDSENVYTVQYKSPEGDVREKTLHRTELKYPIVSAVPDKSKTSESDDNEDSSDESDLEIVFETEPLNETDVAELRPHDFPLPVPPVSDSTAVKEIEVRDIGEGSKEALDGVGRIEERGGTCRLGGLGDKTDEAVGSIMGGQLGLNNEVTEVAPRHSKRQTAGKHSNIHRLPRSVNQQEMAGQQFSVTDQSLADLSQAHRMLVEVFAKRF